jgi:hypothetical protein
MKERINTTLNLRNTTLKRPSMPMSVYSTPGNGRRGREMLSEAGMWGNSGRLVVQKLEQEDGTDAEAKHKQVAEQFVIDHAIMEQMQNAINHIAQAVNSNLDSIAALDNRVEEQQHMKVDEQKMRPVEIAHIRENGEILHQQNTKTAERLNGIQKESNNNMETQDTGVQGPGQRSPTNIY